MSEFVERRRFRLIRRYLARFEGRESESEVLVLEERSSELNVVEYLENCEVSRFYRLEEL